MGREYFEAVPQRSNRETKGKLHTLSESSGFGGTMCAGISISVVWRPAQYKGRAVLAREDEPLSERLPFKYSGVPIVSNTFKSFSVMCR